MTESSLKLKVGEEVTQFFIIRDIETLTKKSDNMPYLKLELGYRNGRVWSNIWDNTERFLSEYQSGDTVKIRGRIEEYRNQTQINIIKIRKSVESDDIHPEDLLPVYPGDLTSLEKQLQKVIKNIKSDHLRELCRSILINSEFGKGYSRSPAGKLWHHGYIGGLLEHSLTVAEICSAVAEMYDDVSKDLLCAGALLHDIGKVDSYTTVPCIEYTDEGRLIGHIVLGYERVRNGIDSIKGFPGDLAKQLLHLILSHQGELEKASPVVPMTLEGIILHYADEIDSRMNAYQRIIKEQKTGHRKWSNYVNLIDRFVYFGESGQE